MHAIARCSKQCAQQKLPQPCKCTFMFLALGCIFGMEVLMYYCLSVVKFIQCHEQFDSSKRRWEMDRRFYCFAADKACSTSDGPVLFLWRHAEQVWFVTMRIWLSHLISLTRPFILQRCLRAQLFESCAAHSCSMLCLSDIQQGCALAVSW